MKVPTRTSLHTRLGLALLAVSLVVAWGTATGRSLDEQDLSVRERWARLSSEERVKLQDRYDAYQAMSDSEQRELAERARNVGHARQRLLRRLTDDQRGRLDSLDQRTRDALVAEMVEDDLRLKGRRVHAMLPEQWRERIERAKPEERRRFFVEFKERHRPRMSLLAIDRLGTLLGKDPEDIKAWSKLPENERLELLIDLRRELASRSIEESGLPAGVTAQGWSEIQTLEPEEFFEAVLRIRQQTSRQEPSQDASPEDTYTERRRAAAVEILATFRTSPSERIELSDLSPAERRARIAVARRDRMQALLEQHEAATPELLESFKSLSDDDFHAYVRRLVRDSGVLRAHRAEHGREVREPDAGAQLPAASEVPAASDASDADEESERR